MAARPESRLEVVHSLDPRDTATIYQDGIVAGVLGAAAVALWFLILDTIGGRPFYTPTVLGTALFRRGADLNAPGGLPISLEMVGMFTWVHTLVFVAIGGIASRLLAIAEQNPSFGFGVLLLFVMFQAGFTVAAMLLAAPIVGLLGWPAVLAANLIAAGAMAVYLWSRHRTLTVAP